jgi:hypothetical protein
MGTYLTFSSFNAAMFIKWPDLYIEQDLDMLNGVTYSGKQSAAALDECIKPPCYPFPTIGWISKSLFGSYKTLFFFVLSLLTGEFRFQCRGFY